VTAAQLLALRAGIQVRIALRGGREVLAEVLGNPWLEASGAPGVGRVRLCVLDIEHARRIVNAVPKHTAFGSSPFAMLRAKYTVRGSQVLEVIS
jgi:hypothetical protein